MKRLVIGFVAGVLASAAVLALAVKLMDEDFERELPAIVASMVDVMERKAEDAAA